MADGGTGDEEFFVRRVGGEFGIDVEVEVLGLWLRLGVVGRHWLCFQDFGLRRFCECGGHLEWRFDAIELIPPYFHLLLLEFSNEYTDILLQLLQPLHNRPDIFLIDGGTLMRPISPLGRIAINPGYLIDILPQPCQLFEENVQGFLLQFYVLFCELG